jgi:hypothetical protein
MINQDEQPELTVAELEEMRPAKEIFSKEEYEELIAVRRNVEQANDNDSWRLIEGLDVTENYGVPYLLFSKELIDEDFNPSGVVDGFYQDGEGWVGGVWDNTQDCYIVTTIFPTHYKEKRGPNV